MKDLLPSHSSDEAFIDNAGSREKYDERQSVGYKGSPAIVSLFDGMGQSKLFSCDAAGRAERNGTPTTTAMWNNRNASSQCNGFNYIEALSGGARDDHRLRHDE
ncbi:hypothetical protein ABFT80_22025 [Mesorhizobium sp. SB112]